MMNKRNIFKRKECSPGDKYRFSFSAIIAATIVGVASLSGIATVSAMEDNFDYPNIQHATAYYGEPVWDDPENEDGCPKFAICTT